MSETVETIELDAYPNLRARIEYDEHPDEPYDDGSVPLIQVEGDSATQITMTSYVVPDGILRAASEYRDDLGTFQRYLRIFHGTTRLQEYGSNNYTDYTYFAFDTAAWRKEVGVTLDALTVQLDLMSEYRAYLEGEVYCIAIDQLQTWENVDSGERREEWEEVDSCGGFYGDPSGYVTERAKEMIADQTL